MNSHHIHVGYLSLLIFMSCASHQSVKKNDVTFLIEQRLSKNAIRVTNSSKTFTLASHQQDRIISFIIIRLEDGKIVEEGNTNGSVGWSSDMEVKVSTIPGIVKLHPDEDDNVRRINLEKYINKF